MYVTVSLTDCDAIMHCLNSLYTMSVSVEQHVAGVDIHVRLY